MSDAGLSPEEQKKRKLATECFRRANEALQKQNWDYAVEMFLTCAKMVPDNLMYRQALRNSEYKKYKGNKTGASMAFLKVSSLRSRIKKARAAKNWTEMDLAAEEGLLLNPWDGQFNADLGEAMRSRDFLEIAQYAYECAVSPDGAPENKEFLIELANIYEQRGSFDKAVGALEKVYKLDPLNGSIRTKIQSISATATIHHGKYDDAKTTQDVKADKPKEVKQGYEESVRGGVNTGKEVLAPGESVEADLQRMIRKEPANVAHYQKLADYYKREGRLEESARTYQQAVEVSGDIHIREQMEDVEVDMVRRNLKFAKEAAAKRPDDPQTREIVVELAKELLSQEIEVYSRRVDRYPNDLKLKFHLGKQFMRAKKYDLAIPLLQAASKDIRQEADVLTNLGTCFLAKKQNNLAKRQFEKALEKLSATEQPLQYKECHYYLGRLSEEGGDHATAEKHYTEILAIDYNYKDVAARLNEIQGGSDEGGNIETSDSE